MASSVGFSKIKAASEKIDPVIFDIGRVLFFVPLKARFSHDCLAPIIHIRVHIIKIHGRVSHISAGGTAWALPLDAGRWPIQARFSLEWERSDRRAAHVSA